MDLRLTNQVIVERHEEELGDRVLNLVARQLTKTDDRAGLKKIVEARLLGASSEKAKIENRREPPEKRFVGLVF